MCHGVVVDPCHENHWSDGSCGAAAEGVVGPGQREVSSICRRANTFVVNRYRV